MNAYVSGACGHGGSSRRCWPCSSARPSAQAATQDVVARQVAETVARQIPGATIQRSAEEPLVGVPGFADLVAGRAEVMMDPAFWTQVTYNLLVSQTVVLPKPVDLVKPEAFLPTVEVADGGRPVWPLPRRDVRGLDDDDVRVAGPHEDAARVRHARPRPTASRSSTTGGSPATCTPTAGRPTCATSRGR